MGPTNSVKNIEWWKVSDGAKQPWYLEWWVMSNEWWVTEIEWPKNGGQIASKFQCLGMSWGCCDNGLKERQRMG